MSLDFSYFYIELTSRCALSCPRCPRTYEKGTYKLDELEIGIISRLLDDYYDEVKTIEFGGNYGDPIYHSNFHKILEIIKLKKPSIKVIIHTNGSHREDRWWRETLKYLNEKDVILFSIDGLADTNHLYRVNSDWDSLSRAIEICKNSVYLLWKFIPFSFNEFAIKDVILYARERGFNAFTMALSSRFNGRWSDDLNSDPLKPSEQYITKRSTDKTTFMSPKCQGGSFHYINASGEYFPCCWATSDDIYKKNISSFNLNQRSLKDIIESTYIKEFSSSVSCLETASKNCKNYCGTNIVSNSSRSSDNRRFINLKSSRHDFDRELETFIADTSNS